MSKKIKIMIVAAFVTGILGGLTEYFSPSINVDEDSIFGPDSLGWESREASTASNGIESQTEDSQRDRQLAPIISAKGAILIDAEDGSVIYEKDADQKLYPASTTKIMTTLVALEIMEEIDAEMDSKVIVPKEAVGVEGSSIYLKNGEEVTVEELLYGTVLQSGNDAATALAICFAGDVESFVEKMNERARGLGCKGTNFKNPSGLFDENHYTTARDLAIISREAMKNDAFRIIAGTKKWSSKATGRAFANKNKTVTEYEGATGIKIGYTKKSGRTLAASAESGDKELIAVVLNDPNWFADAYAMLDYGFARQ